MKFFNSIILAKEAKEIAKGYKDKRKADSIKNTYKLCNGRILNERIRGCADNGHKNLILYGKHSEVKDIFVIDDVRFMPEFNYNKIDIDVPLFIEIMQSRGYNVEFATMSHLVVSWVEE